jgi:hypothetical protein
MDTLSELEVSQLAFVRRNFGYFGGIGDPPSNDDILAIMLALRVYDIQTKTRQQTMTTPLGPDADPTSAAVGRLVRAVDAFLAERMKPFPDSRFVDDDLVVLAKAMCDPALAPFLPKETK